MSSSMLLSLSSKLSLRKLALRCSNSLGTRIRMFSSTNPYLLYRVTSSDGDKEGAMTELHMFDPAKEETFTVGDKPLPEEMVQSRLVGSSKGWGVYFTCPNYILISDFCNPNSSKTDPKIICLHPRTRMKGSQTQMEIVSGVAMSYSSSPEAKDFIMAVKYTGRLLSTFTHGQGEEEKLNILYTYPKVVDYFEHSKLMNSKRDEKFYMPSAGGHHLLSWDGVSGCSEINYHESSRFPGLDYHELRFHGLPQFPHSELQLLDSCHKTQHLVESPSGKRFLVKWYAQILRDKHLNFECAGTKRFMVFREEEEMNMCYTYTEDIGDLCIFLGNNNEPFCLKASSFPGLKPNSIYFAGEGFGVYDIATRTPRSFNQKSLTAFSTLPRALRHWAPHWLPPFPL